MKPNIAGAGTKITKRDVQQPSAVSVPAPITSGPHAALVFAVERFARQPVIEQCICTGSNGTTLNLPSSLDRRLELWHSWPDARRCFTLSGALRADLATAASIDQIADAASALVASYPTGERAPIGYIAAVQALLIEEADLQGWGLCSITGGMIDVLRVSRFLPAPCEIFQAVRTSSRKLRSAAWAAEAAGEAAIELQVSLEEAGLIPDPFDPPQDFD